MRRTSLAATLGMLALAATSFAAPAKTSEAWAAGQLERVDPATKAVVVKQGSHEMTFTLKSDAHVMQGKKTLQASDLTSDVGHYVKVRYRMDGTTRVADRIEVAAAPAATKPAVKHPSKG
jgi:hypothetical protein